MLGGLDTYLANGLFRPVPRHANPADLALDAVTTDFIADPGQRAKHISDLALRWFAYAAEHAEQGNVSRLASSWSSKDGKSLNEKKGRGWERGTSGLGGRVRSVGQGAGRGVHQTRILMERNMLNYSRNLLAYGVRLGMYLGMGILLATVWVNLAQTSAKIVRSNFIHSSNRH